MNPNGLGSTHGRVLLVDEATELVESLGLTLGRAGYEVLSANGPGSAAKTLRDGRPDVVILDINVGRWSGLDVLQRIRTRSNVPVVMLINGDSYHERAVCQATGADVCLSKPLDVRELVRVVGEWVARDRPTPRRGESGSTALDEQARTASIDGQPLSLTAIEYRVLSYLMLHAGQTVSLDALRRYVWGPGQLGASILLPSALATLASKLNDSAADRRLLVETPEGIRLQ